MVNPELVSYILTNREKGVSDSIIKANLRTQGWNDADFAEAAKTLPAPNSKVDGPVLSKLLEGAVMTNPGGTAEVAGLIENRRSNAIMKKMLVFLFILVLLVIAIAIWGVIALYFFKPELLQTWMLKLGIK